MSTKAQALKRLRQSEKRRLRNLSVRSRLKTEIKKVRLAITANTLEIEKIRLAQSLLDKAVSHNVIHKRQAARRKSRLARAANKLTAK